MRFTPTLVSFLSALSALATAQSANGNDVGNLSQYATALPSGALNSALADPQVSAIANGDGASILSNTAVQSLLANPSAFSALATNTAAAASLANQITGGGSGPAMTGTAMTASANSPSSTGGAGHLVNPGMGLGAAVVLGAAGLL